MKRSDVLGLIAAAATAGGLGIIGSAVGLQTSVGAIAIAVVGVALALTGAAIFVSLLLDVTIGIARRDVTIGEAVGWIIEPGNFTPAAQLMEGRLTEFERALKVLRQAAFDGDVTIWGVRVVSVWEPIPSVFWKDHSIDGVRLLHSENEVPSRTLSHGRAVDTYYHALMLSKVQVRKQWPRRGKWRMGR